MPSRSNLGDGPGNLFLSITDRKRTKCEQQGCVMIFTIASIEFIVTLHVVSRFDQT